MRILFIARHGSGDADPEGAITYALQQLEHEVICVHESNTIHSVLDHKHDLCLFLKWDNTIALKQLTCPKVFWYFDLVDAKDPLVATRSERRIDWMRRITSLVDLGFMSDGDWVQSQNHDTSGKLIHLMQGADERVTGPGVALDKNIDLLFLGSERNGTQRAQWLQWMRQTYGSRFVEVGAKYRHGRQVEWPTVQRDLANLIARAKIVVAPDGPQTDRYWSNRVYQVLGMQGFLLHPYCAELTDHYANAHQLVMYCDRNNMRDLIEWYLQRPLAREGIALNGYEYTLHHHLYRHRLQTMLSIVKERLGVG